MSVPEPKNVHSVFELKFPDELYGVVIEDVDLAILNSDSLRLIDAYSKQGGDLSEIQWKVLAQCDAELKLVIPQVKKEHQKIFLVLQEAIAHILKQKI